MAKINQCKLFIVMLLVFACFSCTTEKHMVNTRREVNHNKPANTEASNIPTNKLPVDAC